MPPKKPTAKDLQRGKRIEAERKKIWKTRAEAARSGVVALRSLTNYETNGVDPSARFLGELSTRGADINYILTGNRKANEPAHEISSFTNKQRMVMRKISATIQWLATEQHHMIEDAGYAEKITRRYVSIHPAERGRESVCRQSKAEELDELKAILGC